MVLGKTPKIPGDIKKGMGDVIESAAGKVNEMLDDFNQAVPTLQALGFSIKDVRADVGVPPQIKAKLTGSVEAIDAKKIQGLIDANSDKKFLVTVLKGLQAASHVKEQLSGLGFKGVEAEIKLGIPPSVSVNFMG